MVGQVGGGGVRMGRGGAGRGGVEWGGTGRCKAPEGSWRWRGALSATPVTMGRHAPACDPNSETLFLCALRRDSHWGARSSRPLFPDPTFYESHMLLASPPSIHTEASRGNNRLTASPLTDILPRLVLCESPAVTCWLHTLHLMKIFN
ncbi:hypothetical protein E2C01_030765 [Portunus trituberculatus]|uniref:Uncharacterized protein n=1 Tax=Portunus trituberculatus TaxID=210409 RepID=A0A5B7ESS0_PORTR|nr:hypothetical protein [Portunus trituberculatus]